MQCLVSVSNSTAESTSDVNESRELQLEPGDIVNKVSLYYWCCLLCSLLHYCILYLTLSFVT